MKVFFKFFMLISSLLFVSVSEVVALKNSNDMDVKKEIVATVNGVDISKEDVNEFVVNSIPGASFQLLNEEQQKSVINKMVERRLFLEDANAIHVKDNPAYIVELHRLTEKLKEKLLLDFWMKQKVEEIDISKEEAEGYYKANIQNFQQASSVKVRHILVPTEEEAKGIIYALNKSESLKDTFIELAKIRSIGPSSTSGGELDWFIHEQMVPEFSDAAFNLEEGTITQQPIQTQFGYHVIYLEERKNKGVIPFSIVQKDIVKLLRMAKFKIKLQKLSETLKKTAEIKMPRK